MNTFKENIYGAAGLFCTIGKNVSGLGQKVSNFNKHACHYTQKAINGAFVVAGKVSEYGANLGGWAKTRFQEGETWANEKAEQAKRAEDWEKINEKYKDVKEKPKVRINIDTEPVFILKSKKTTFLPSCLRFQRV